MRRRRRHGGDGGDGNGGAARRGDDAADDSELANFYVAHEAGVAALNDPAFWCAEETLAAIERGTFERACDSSLPLGEPGACAPREA